MSLIDHLVAADRIVLAGLSAYDSLCQRELNNGAARLRQLGESEENIAELLDEHRASIKRSRSNLHRDLWKKALAQIAACEPDAP